MFDARDAARKMILGAARWSGAAALARPLLSGAGAILMLHRVTAARISPLGLNCHLAVSPDFLDLLLCDLRRRGFALVGLDELIEALPSGRRRMVAITADDGWLDNLTEALPVFEAHEAPFTVYVATGLAGGEVLPWWEVLEELVARSDSVRLPAADGEEVLDCADPASKRAVAARLMKHVATEIAEEQQQAFLAALGARAAGPRRFMNWDELRRLAGHRLACLGAHTVHHYNLSRLPAETALREMEDSAAVIGAETGLRPRHFAYPYGYPAAVGAREVELARQAGFASAVTTRHGVLHPEHVRHLHALPRISLNGGFQQPGHVRTMLSGLTTPLANGGRRLVTV